MKESKWFALLLVLTAPLLSVIDVFIINVAIPAIRKGIHASAAELQLVIVLYMLAYASLLVTGGRSGDHYGRKKIFLGGMLGFTLASALCGLAQTPIQLNSARFLQGIAAAYMVPQTIAYIQILFPDPRERARATGWYGITLGLASMLGQFLGGLLTSLDMPVAGWRLIFFINVPIGIAAVALGSRYLKETPSGGKQRFDIAGVLILTLALCAFIIPLIAGREQNWPWWCVALLSICPGIFAWFYYNQSGRKAAGKQPLVDMAIFRIRDFNLGILAVICCFVVHASFLLMSALLFQNGFGFSPLASGGSFMVWGGTMLVFSLWSIRLVAHNGKMTVLSGVALMFSGVLLQSIFFTGSELPAPWYLLILMVHGAGAGLSYSTLLNVTMRGVPAAFAGASSGVFSTAQQAAAALGVAGVGGLFFTVLVHGSYQEAFRYGSMVNLGVLAVMGALVAGLPAQKK